MSKDNINIKVKMYHPQKTADRICENRQVGLFLANTWGNYFDKYTPMQEGILMSNKTIEPFTVTYDSPYAHYQWEGISRFSGNPLNYSKEQNPLATSHWEVPAYEAFQDSVAKQVTAFIRRLG